MEVTSSAATFIRIAVQASASNTAENMQAVKASQYIVKRSLPASIEIKTLIRKLAENADLPGKKRQSHR